MGGFWRITIAFAIPWAIAGGVLVAIRANRSSPPAPAVLRVRTLDAPRVRFNRDILPILSDNCFACHGPDSAARKADLRLYLPEGATAELASGGHPIVPGDPDASELIRRVSAERPAQRMPPPEIGKSLTAEQIQWLRTWIEQGATWEPHWAFIAPKQSEQTPTDATHNAIDRFIAARLASEGLSMSPPASRVTLIRRVSLDLTGLPPTPQEADAFLADHSPEAYERLVDRLLASPRYGEHMARYWLDAARYADTHGLHLDNNREIWPYRDWVINAFNANKPFDEFTIEQLAGDLLPEPTSDQLIATGFNRNHVTTSEGGAIDAEYLMRYAADRVETTATVWLGLTVGCAQCHDHKFDPISQREYYKLFAFFNSVDSPAMDGNAKDHPPVIRVPSEQDKVLLAELRGRIASLEDSLDAPDASVDTAQHDWQTLTSEAWNSSWEILDPITAHSTAGATLTVLDDLSILATGDNPDKDVHEITARTEQTSLRMIRLEALTHEDLPFTGPGRAENANFVLSEIEAEIVSLRDPTRRREINLIAAAADFEQSDGPYPASAAIDAVIDDTNGWAVDGFNRRENRVAIFVSEKPFGYPGGSEIHIRLRYETQFPRHAIGRTRLAVSANSTLLETIAPIGFGSWWAAGPFTGESDREVFDAAYPPESSLNSIDPQASLAEDGSITWVERTDFADGVVNTLEGENTATYVARKIDAPSPRQITLNLGSDDAIKVWLNGRLIHENYVARGVTLDQDTVGADLHAGENILVMKIVNFSGGYGFAFRASDDNAAGELLANIDLVLADHLDAIQQTHLRRYFRANHSPAMRELSKQLSKVQSDLNNAEAALPTTLVMKSLPEPRMTTVLIRGQYDKPGEQVSPGVPACLPDMDRSFPNNRLGLALWLTDPQHPLMARVTVNRLWQQVFGTGIVKTSGNFGTQGERPTHPELLDFLALELINSGWDIKHMMRLLVMSKAYRQGSSATPKLLQRDPNNRLYARGPRHRLDAEVIRDQALAASGLLVEKLGGKSVKPFQPDGLWRAVAYPDSNTQVYIPGGGDENSRRSLYTYWKRTSPPPNLTAFDAPSRETCTIRRDRTNTPLQALVLLNDPQFVRFARGIAARSILDAPNESIDARLILAFRLLLVRAPSAQELNILRDLYDRQIQIYRADPSMAQSLVASDDSMPNEPLDIIEFAAMTNVCTTILSLDETITKN